MFRRSTTTVRVADGGTARTAESGAARLWRRIGQAAVMALALAQAGEAMAAAQMTVKNLCKQAVWIQQLNVPGAPQVVKVAPNDAYVYKIPNGLVPATRFWPKQGCDASGQNCTLGQTMAPCDAKNGCAPPIDSKLEVTWCDGPSCQTWYNLSAVDGYTLPTRVVSSQAKSGQPTCTSFACPTLTFDQCPTNVNLDATGKYPSLRNEDLRMFQPGTKKVIGCFSPCGKLTFAKQYGAYNYLPQSEQAKFYCCKGTADTKATCAQGPIETMSYVKLVDKACRNQVYGWAYDDAQGLHVCTGQTNLTFEICAAEKTARK